jgi:hypothetical protein
LSARVPEFAKREIDRYLKTVCQFPHCRLTSATGFCMIFLIAMEGASVVMVGAIMGPYR